MSQYNIVNYIEKNTYFIDYNTIDYVFCISIAFKILHLSIYYRLKQNIQYTFMVGILKNTMMLDFFSPRVSKIIS